MKKAKQFWLRLNVACMTIDMINEKRTSLAEKPLTHSPKDAYLDVVFKTDVAFEIWELIEEYDVIKDVVLSTLHEMEDMQFHLQSSINKEQDLKKYGQNPTEFEKLVRVDLFTHTKNVMSFALTKKDKVSDLMPTLLLLTLFHDSGKAKEMVKKFQQSPKTPHEVCSALYLQKMLTQAKIYSSDYIESLASIISLHHSTPATNLLNSMLNECDQKAREFEKKL